MAVEDYTTRGSGSFSAIAIADGAISAVATTIQYSGLNQPFSGFVVPPMTVMIEDEILKLISIDTGTTSMVVERGCADTVPAAHPDDAPIWFLGAAVGTDSVEYAPSQTIAVKVLARTATSAPVPIAFSPPNDLTFAARFARPYPPGRVRVKGDPFFTVTGFVVPGEITWAHRNRLTQADILVGHEETSITPEAGTTYTVRVLASDGTTVLRTVTGITGDSWTYEGDDYVTDGSPASGYIELLAVRDGYNSFQRYRGLFNLELGVGWGRNYGFNWGSPS